jgi:hypothetical protein
MTGIKLSTLSFLLGIGFALPQIYGLLNPGKFATRLKRFPRDRAIGCILMIVATAWFLYNLGQERISDFAPYKPYMYVGFTALGVLTCIFVPDFLAVRGLALLLLLLAKVALDTQRWEETGWKNVITAWAYVWAIAGMWLSVSPWRLRDWIEWNTATEQRVRIGSALRLAFGIFVAALALHFRTVEKKMVAQAGSAPVMAQAATTLFPGQ